jgi:NADPH2:quinone reductase
VLLAATTTDRPNPTSARARIAALLGSGEVEVEVAQVFDLADAAKAHEAGETGRTRGKLVLRVGA